jgi:hypothetical protein
MPVGNSLAEARAEFLSAMDALEAIEDSGNGQSFIDGLPFYQMVVRRAQHRSLRLIARAERRGEFAERGVRPAPAVADMARCRLAEAG